MFYKNNAKFVVLIALILPAQIYANDNLVAYWNFDNCEIADITNNYTQVSLVGDPQCVEGKIGQAYKFDGIDDAIKISNFSLDFSNDFTISLWFMPIINSSFAQVSHRIILNREQAFEVAISPHEYTSTRIWDNDEAIKENDIMYAVHDDWDWYSSNYSVKSTQFYFFTISYSKTDNVVKSYINTIKTSEDIIGNGNFDQSNPIHDFLCIGARGNCDTCFFLGTIDEIQFFNKQLSDYEIYQLYKNEQMSCPEKDLLVLNLENFLSDRINATETYNTKILDMSQEISKHQELIFDLKNTINTMYTNDQYNNAINIIRTEKDSIISDKNNDIKSLNDVLLEKNIEIQRLNQEINNLTGIITNRDSTISTSFQTISNRDQQINNYEHLISDLSAIIDKIDQLTEVKNLQIGYSVSLTEGWHLLSSLIEKATPKTIPENGIEVMYYFQDGAYRQATELLPGKGYWVKIVNDCEFILEP